MKIFCTGNRPFTLTLSPDDAEAPLSRLLWLNTPLPVRPLCSGLGTCGRCRVRLAEAPSPLEREKAVLDAPALAAGWRLACCHTPKNLGLAPDGTLSLEIAPEETPGEDHKATSAARPVAMAFDIGTTSLCWAGVNANGSLSCEGSCLNPQAAAGSDVISRLGLARDPGKRRILSDCVRKRMQAEIPTSVERLLVCGNTAMSYIFLDTPVDGLCAAPLRMGHRGNAYFSLPGFPPVFIPPLPAPFIGSDVSCGLLSQALRGQKAPWMIIDLGTNAEFALRTDDALYLASVPMGPAVEGIGMRCGRLAGEGVVTGYSLDARGLLGLPRGARSGISATGYFSLLATLSDIGVLDADGHFVATHPVPFVRRVLAGLVTHEGLPRLLLPDGLFLDASDIEACLTVKAAFCAAFVLLLDAARLSAGDLGAVFLAGALGTHSDPAALGKLGFFPVGCPRCEVLGNTALSGALEILRHPGLVSDLVRLCESAHILELTDDPRFSTLFFQSMRFTPPAS